MKLVHVDNQLAAEELLDERLQALAGQWVAIADHKVVANCATAEELYELTAGAPVERRFRVPG